MTTQPTRTLLRQDKYLDGGSETQETETEAKASVEVGETAKGDLTIKSIKVYANDVTEAGRAALAEYRRLKAEIMTAVTITAGMKVPE